AEELVVRFGDLSRSVEDRDADHSRIPQTAESRLASTQGRLGLELVRDVGEHRHHTDGFDAFGHAPLDGHGGCRDARPEDRPVLSLESEVEPLRSTLANRLEDLSECLSSTGSVSELTK